MIIITFCFSRQTVCFKRTKRIVLCSFPDLFFLHSRHLGGPEIKSANYTNRCRIYLLLLVVKYVYMGQFTRKGTYM